MAQKAERARKQERYEAQEAKRATPVQIDQKVVLWAWLAGVGISFIAAAVISFNGITAEAVKIGLSAGWMQYLMFFVVEALYIVFLVAYLILASRAEKTLGPLLGMWFFAGVAIYANAMHSFNHNNWEILSVDTWTGVVLGVSAPIAIIAASKLASRVVFAKREELT